MNDQPKSQPVEDPACGDRGLMVLSHGRESGPEAKKVTLLKPIAVRHGWRVVTPDYRGMTPEDRVALLLNQVTNADCPVALAGSSMGGIISVLAAQKLSVHGLFLMAPAVYFPGYEDMDHQVRTPLIHIMHGWRDEVVSPESVIRFAREHSALLHLVDDDHHLSGRFDRLERLFVDFLSELDAIISGSHAQ